MLACGRESVKRRQCMPPVVAQKLGRHGGLPLQTHPIRVKLNHYLQIAWIVA